MDSNKADDIPSVFHEFMLKQLELSSTHSRHISTVEKQTEQFYLAAVTAVVGGAFVLLSSQSGIGAIIVIALSCLLVAMFGTQRTLRSQMHFEAEVNEIITRSGLIRYFRQFAPEEFERSGGQIELAAHEIPYYWLEFGRAPWTQIKLAGYFATAHGCLLAIGLGLIAGALIDLYSTFFRTWVNLFFPILLAEAVFHTYLYWLSKQARKRHQNARALRERLLQVYEGA